MNTEQKTYLESRIETHNRNTSRRISEHNQLKTMIVEAGWIEGEHFVDTSKVELKEEVFGTGYYGDEDREEVKVEVTCFDGHIQPIVTVEGEDGLPTLKVRDCLSLVPAKRGYSSKKYKPTVRCSEITNDRRSCNAKTLLEKLNDHNRWSAARIEREYEVKNKYENQFVQFTKEFSNCKVEKASVKNSWGGYRTYPGFKITLENGSYIEILDGKIEKRVDNKLETIENIGDCINYLK